MNKETADFLFWALITSPVWAPAVGVGVAIALSPIAALLGKKK